MYQSLQTEIPLEVVNHSREEYAFKVKKKQFLGYRISCVKCIQFNHISSFLFNASFLLVDASFRNGSLEIAAKILHSRRDIKVI